MGLARPGHAHHHRDPVAVAGDRLHHRALLVGQAGQRTFVDDGRAPARAGAHTGCRPCDHAPFDLDLLRRRVAGPEVVLGQHDDAATFEVPVGVRLQVGDGRPMARPLGEQSQHVTHVTTGEHGLLLAQPVAQLNRVYRHCEASTAADLGC
jgi:hypothetical protein